MRVPPFIATLGMMGIARGLALIISNGIPIYGLDDRYKFIGQGKFFDVIPVPTVIVLVVYAIGFVVMNYTRFGRFIYAIGSNAEAARLSGINVRAVHDRHLHDLRPADRPCLDDRGRAAGAPCSRPAATATSCWRSAPC